MSHAVPSTRSAGPPSRPRAALTPVLAVTISRTVICVAGPRRPGHVPRRPADPAMRSAGPPSRPRAALTPSRLCAALARHPETIKVRASWRGVVYGCRGAHPSDACVRACRANQATRPRPRGGSARDSVGLAGCAGRVLWAGSVGRVCGRVCAGPDVPTWGALWAGRVRWALAWAEPSGWAWRE